MIGYTLKHIINLLPEILPLVKTASLERDYPIDSKENCLASALVIEYKKSVGDMDIDYYDMIKVAEATEVFGLKETLTDISVKLTDKMKSGLKKQAAEASALSYPELETLWESYFQGINTNIKQVAEEATSLFQKAASLGIEPSDKVKIYSGQGYLLKEGVLAALNNRYSITKDETLVKLAAAVGREQDLITSERTVKSLCAVINRIDDSYNLSAMGFDFYKEAMISKEAGSNYCNITLFGKEYPLETLLKIPDEYYDQYVEKDFAKELKGDPNSAKSLIESLPYDTKQSLSVLLKSC